MEAAAVHSEDDLLQDLNQAEDPIEVIESSGLATNHDKLSDIVICWGKVDGNHTLVPMIQIVIMDLI